MNQQAIACDVHTHLIPVHEGQLASELGVAWDIDKKVLTVDGHRVAVPALFERDQLVRWMDDNQVARAFVSVPPPVYRDHLGEAESLRWAGRLNRGLQRIADKHPTRLTALYHIPIRWPKAAAAVAAEGIAAGTKTFAAPTGAPGVQIADAAFRPLWQALSDAGSFLFMHPGSCADGRLDSFYMGNLVGNPHETGVALASLVLGGVLAKYPGIQFCFAHGGGSAPMLAARLQRGFATARPDVDLSLPSPQSLFGNVIVDCITHSEPALELAEAVFGKQNIVFGSDWPFPMGIMQPSQQLASMDPERVQRLCCSGAIRLKYNHPANQE
ncbi:amidohydrolase [Mesorhizobium sp. M0659]|uniref:amidohydrolase family protein n=1 Tax=Mesorhizobium sp. M0659 TaxID=2956980 RepID=UPI003336ACC1